MEAILDKPKVNRFKNNTKSVPVDRRRVHGFAPGVFNMMIEPRGSNLPSIKVPQGQLIIFNPKLEKTVDADWKPAKMEIPGQHFADNVKAQFQDGAAGDMGYRTLEFLKDLDYNEDTGYDEADFYFAVVHPPFQAIGRKCDMGLESRPDPENGDLPMPCPTCRLEWLNSDDCTLQIETALSMNATLKKDIFTKLRTTLINSYEAGRDFHQAKLNRTDADILARSNGQPGKGAYDDADLYYAATLHKKAPHIEQAEIQARTAQIQGEAIGRSIGGGADPLAGMSNTEKAEFYAWKAEKEKSNAVSAEEVLPETAALEPIKIGAKVLYDEQEGVVKMKPGGKYVVEFADGNKTLTREEIKEATDNE